MLELIIAGSMLAGVMTSLSVVMRTARQSWEINDAESAALHQMQAVGRHFVRSARECRAVSNISADATSVTLVMRDGIETQWAWRNAGSGMSDVVIVGSSADGTESVLAQNIRSLQFVGYDADGVTVVSDPDEIRMLTIAVAIDLPGAADPQRQLRSSVWIRSW
ncbi:hypothetical protein [Planctomycetes bacterium K23_9]|uniref:General secretion pathway GspH domain-containing protein n=1 Tax=Stieleria marina TaxID=1930275 RepID=A0A517NWC1_9BACT|nr:hypothetical protein K239x_34240 [Planctomycetes bacterium K23_9]